jgi:YD repeat-containing protein
VDYVYDLAGKIHQDIDPTGSYGFAYDNMGRILGTIFSVEVPTAWSADGGL